MLPTWFSPSPHVQRKFLAQHQQQQQWRHETNGISIFLIATFNLIIFIIHRFGRSLALCFSVPLMPLVLPGVHQMFPPHFDDAVLVLMLAANDNEGGVRRLRESYQQSGNFTPPMRVYCCFRFGEKRKKVKAFHFVQFHASPCCIRTYSFEASADKWIFQTKHQTPIRNVAQVGGASVTEKVSHLFYYIRNRDASILVS